MIASAAIFAKLVADVPNTYLWSESLAFNPRNLIDSRFPCDYVNVAKITFSFGSAEVDCHQSYVKRALPEIAGEISWRYRLAGTQKPSLKALLVLGYRFSVSTSALLLAPLRVKALSLIRPASNGDDVCVRPQLRKTDSAVIEQALRVALENPS